MPKSPDHKWGRSEDTSPGLGEGQKPNRVNQQTNGSPDDTMKEPWKPEDYIQDSDESLMAESKEEAVETGLPPDGILSCSVYDEEVVNSSMNPPPGPF